MQAAVIPKYIKKKILNVLFFGLAFFLQYALRTPPLAKRLTLLRLNQKYL